MKIFFTLLLLSLFQTQASSQNIVGKWIAEIAIPNGKLDFEFKIAKVGDQYESTLSIPKQGLTDGKAASTIFSDSVLIITFPNFNIAYKGTVNDKNEIIGNLIKGGLPSPLNLRRGEITLNRPQEPKPPFSYYSEDITFTTFDNLKLQGTLTLPKKVGKFPVVIIVSGSGPQNRDGEMFGHKPYYVIADDLTKKGIGVLRFDERGVGKSQGNFETATINILASDIKSALKYLKTRKEVNAKKIGLIGHSIGGIIAPKVASENNSVKFIVLMAAPGVNGDKLMLSQKAAMEKKMGFDEMQIAQGQELVKGAYDIIVNSNLDGPILKDSINSFYSKRFGNAIPKNQIESLVNQMTGTEFLSLIRSKPSLYLQKIKCDVLAINGSYDLQVPSKENLVAIKSSVEANGNRSVTIVEIEKLNHLFQESTTGMLKEYAEIEQTISSEVLDLISNWISKTTK